jgi:hypothetical protein
VVKIQYDEIIKCNMENSQISEYIYSMSSISKY